MADPISEESHHATLLAGLAEWLAANGFGVYRENGMYAADERGIVLAAFPETPNELLSVGLYQPEYTRFSPTSPRRLTATGVQIRWRLAGDPLDGVRLFDRLSQLIDRRALVLGGITARGLYRSYGTVGQDANRRWLHTSNWKLTALEPL